MSVTLANLKTNLNTYIGDASTDRISDAERNEALTEAVVWLQEELGNEHMIDTYELEYLEGVYNYKVTTPLATLLMSADLRRGQDDHEISFAHKSPREMAEEIGNHFTESSWTVERKDGDIYLVINHRSSNPFSVLGSFDSLTADGGTWTADTTTSDATNITIDNYEYTKGSASLNFDVDVSQSGNNKATIYIAKSSESNLSALEDNSSFLLDVYIPDVTYVASVNLKWSSDDTATPATISNYWSKTSTTDYNGNALVNGWNTMKFDWRTSTVTGTPNAETIQYFQIDINYSASQADDTDFRLDNFGIVKPETLTFHYTSWNVGDDTNGTPISAFSADTDVPFFSGRYDKYKYAVAHKAASILYYSPLRLDEKGQREEAQAIQHLDRYRKIFESSITKELKSFKVKGVNLRDRRARRFRRTQR